MISDGGSKLLCNELRPSGFSSKSWQASIQCGGACGVEDVGALSVKTSLTQVALYTLWVPTVLGPSVISLGGKFHGMTLGSGSSGTA